MKKSKYNFVYKRENGDVVIYNTYSKAVILLTDQEYQHYITSDYEKIDTVQYKENGILIDDDFDELHFLKYMHYKAKFSRHNLHLTIAPTLDCNFDCPYCYENRRNGKMSKEVQDALIDFVKDRINEGTENIDISWYGGEPLLYFDIVEYLALKIRKLAEDNDCGLKMYIVTNGYLLSKDVIRRLDEIGIIRVQITLDGLAEHHDKSRPLRNGGRTFDRIFTNLELFEDSPIQVVIRMNVDNNNYSDYKILKQKIKKLDNPNITIYPSPVEDINKDKINNISNFMSDDEFEGFALNECDELNDDTNDFGIVDDRCSYCAAELENSYVVDELGDFYKCWDEVGRKEFKCFNVLSQENINYKSLLWYLSCDVFENEKCVDCVYLPVCFGGCKFQQRNLHKLNCGYSKEIMIQYLEKSFFKDN